MLHEPNPVTSFLVYGLVKLMARIVFSLFFPLRSSGAHVLPRTGPVLLLSNHQSFLDPLVLGLPLRRQLKALARKTLFRFPPFRWLIHNLGAYPIDQEGVAKEGLKSGLQALDHEHVLLVFPEGSRTPDGALQPLQKGVLLLLRRSKAPVILAGISGAFESYPIHAPAPVPAPIWVHFEEWHYPQTESPHDWLADLQDKLAKTVAEADRRRRQLNESCRFRLY